MSKLLWFALGGLSVIGVAVAAAVLDGADSSEDSKPCEDDEADACNLNSITALPHADADN